jgi:XXXCH domain-containing protein
MDKDFKALVKAAEAGAVPAAGQVAPFVADSRLMCTYPGKGDEFYSAFLAAVDAFEAAVASSDAAAFAEAVGGLARLKKDCHAKYK